MSELPEQRARNRRRSDSQGVLSFRSEAREASGTETTRVHHAVWRRGGCMAASSACAAGGKAADDRIPGRGCFGLQSMDDPVGSGLVASLAKPGGNVTGLSLQAANLA